MFLPLVCLNYLIVLPTEVRLTIPKTCPRCERPATIILVPTLLVTEAYLDWYCEECRHKWAVSRFEQLPDSRVNRRGVSGG